MNKITHVLLNRVLRLVVSTPGADTVRRDDGPVLIRMRLGRDGGD